MSNKAKKRNRKYNIRKASDQMDSINNIHGAQPRVILNDPVTGFSKRASSIEVNGFIKSQNEEKVMNDYSESVKTSAKKVFENASNFANETKAKAKSVFNSVKDYVKTTRSINTSLRNDVVAFNVTIASLAAVFMLFNGATAGAVFVFLAAQTFVAILTSELFSLFHGYNSVVEAIHAKH